MLRGGGVMVVVVPAVVSAPNTAPGALSVLCPSAASIQKELCDDIPLSLLEFIAPVPSLYVFLSSLNCL